MSKSDVFLRDVDGAKVYRRPNGSIRVDHVNYEKSMTQQCFAESADINNIMKRWLNGGPPPVSDAARATFRDVSSGQDYQEILHTVMEVQESFDTLPADMRARFKNDPAQLLAFIENPANTDECVQLGLFDEEPPEQLPLDVTVRTDTAVVS